MKTKYFSPTLLVSLMASLAVPLQTNPTQPTPFELLGIKKESLHGYEILGFKANPPIRELDPAFRRLALKWHPDKAQDSNAGAVFKLINEAKNNPTKIFFTNESKNTLNHQINNGPSLASLGIEKEDFVRLFYIMGLGASICVLVEIRNFILKRKRLKSLANKQESNTNQSPSAA